MNTKKKNLGLTKTSAHPHNHNLKMMGYKSAWMEMGINKSDQFHPTG